MAFFWNSAKAADPANYAPPSDAKQLKLPLLTGIGLVLGVLLWLGSYMGMIAVLIPARIAEIDPDNKASIFATMSAIAMVVSTIANVLEGAWSDRTCSRWGRRTPWICFGSVGAAICTYFWGMAESTAAIIMWDAIYMIFLNAIVAPMVAVLSDKIAPRHRGTISSMYAIGMSAGVYGGQIVSSWFIGVNIEAGVILMAILVLLSGPVAALIIREKSTVGMPVQRLTMQNILDNFAFPIKDCRDFYLALFGKLCVVSAQFTVGGYQLYILTDYIHLADTDAARYISYISVLLMVFSLSFAFISGPIADRLHVRKWPVVIASCLMAIGCIIPSFAPQAYLMLVYAVISGIGYGLFSSMDQALNIEVLPNEKTAAKDLGILNIANNGGQVFGPILSSTVIAFAGYDYVFHLGFGMAMVGAILLVMIKRVR